MLPSLMTTLFPIFESSYALFTPTMVLFPIQTGPWTVESCARLTHIAAMK
jgi:hypothetical protein